MLSVDGVLIQLGRPEFEFDEINSGTW